MHIPISETRPAELLLVEDNDGDFLLVKESFREAKFAVNMHRVVHGEECMGFLRKQGEYLDVPTPDLVLLDLNMPIMDGREVLREIVADERLKQLPVVILTTSASEKDVLDMYKLRCSSYIVKPVDFEQFRNVINEMCDYWFTLVVPPRG